MSLIRSLIASGFLIVSSTAMAQEVPASPHQPAMQAGGCAKHNMQQQKGSKGCGGMHHKGQHGKGHHGMGHGKAMRHANPMPNLMKVVKKHGDQLGLSEDQKNALADWRSYHMEPMHARVEMVAKLEAELSKAAMAGRPKAELMSLASRIMNERMQIISTKANCRDNLRRVLTPEQFQKVLSMYQQ